MKETIKAATLISILILPVIVYLMLREYGENHFKLPTYIPVIDSTTGEPLVVKNMDKKGNESEMDTVYRTIPDFTLTDQNGKAFTQAQTKGKVYVADFFFTRCGSICPKISSQLTRFQDTFLNNDEVLIVSHSVDPENDTPEVLQKYAKSYDAKAGKWHFLTGSKKDIYNLALKGYFIPVSDASVYDKAIKNPDEAFIHSEKLILIDKEGHIRGFYDGTSQKDVDRLLLETKVLLKIYETK
jgi:protein SCO1